METIDAEIDEVVFDPGPTDNGRLVVAVGVAAALDDMGQTFCRRWIFNGVPTGQLGILNVKVAIGNFSVKDESALDHCATGCAFFPVAVRRTVGMTALHEFAVFDISLFWPATLLVIHTEYALAQVADIEPPAAEVRGSTHFALSSIKASILWKA